MYDLSSTSKYFCWHSAQFMCSSQYLITLSLASLKLLISSVQKYVNDSVVCSLLLSSRTYLLISLLFCGWITFSNLCITLSYVSHLLSGQSNFLSFYTPVSPVNPHYKGCFVFIRCFVDFEIVLCS